MEETPTAPAGWYPDSENPGGLRYFDSKNWTGHRTPPPPITPGSRRAPADPKTFAGSVQTCLLEKYVTFSGRAGRPEYWWFFLFVGAANLVFSFLPILGTVASLALVVPMVAVAVRRLHDTGKSGWWLVVPLSGYVAGTVALTLTMVGVFFALVSAPTSQFSSLGDFSGGLVTLGVVGALVWLASGIVLLVLMVLPGDREANRYGPPVP